MVRMKAFDRKKDESMEFIPQFFSNSRTLLVLGFMAWGLVAYGVSRRLKRARLLIVERERS